MIRLAQSSSHETVTKLFGNLFTVILAGLILWISAKPEAVTLTRLLKLAAIWIGIPMAAYLLVIQCQSAPVVSEAQQQQTSVVAEAKVPSTETPEDESPRKVRSPSRSPKASPSASPAKSQSEAEKHTTPLRSFCRAATIPMDLVKNKTPFHRTFSANSRDDKDGEVQMTHQRRRSSSLCPIASLKHTRSVSRRSSSESSRPNSVKTERVKTTFHFKSLVPFLKNRRASVE